MNTKNWILIMLFLPLIILPLNLRAEEASVLDFFRQIEGVWKVPQVEGSLNSIQRSYSVQGSHVLVQGQSYSEDEKGQYLFTAFMEEYSVRENQLFRYQNSSEGIIWVELVVVEVTSTKLSYHFTKKTDVLYTRIHNLEILPNEKLMFSQTVFIDGELQSSGVEEIFER